MVAIMLTLGILALFVAAFCLNTLLPGAERYGVPRRRPVRPSGLLRLFTDEDHRRADAVAATLYHERLAARQDEIGSTSQARYDAERTIWQSSAQSLALEQAQDYFTQLQGARPTRIEYSAGTEEYRAFWAMGMLTRSANLTTIQQAWSSRTTFANLQTGNLQQAPGLPQLALDHHMRQQQMQANAALAAQSRGPFFPS